MEPTQEQKEKFAPITLFAYNRVDHLQKTVESLKQNEESKKSRLFIFSDGPKNPENEGKVALVREYIKTIDGFAQVTITERTKNFGLASSIINGVTEIIEKFGRVIVIEDDLVFSPYFLKFLNDTLNMYEKDEKVMHITGYLLPIDKKYKLPETFFLRFISPLGWATWSRAWKHLNTDPKILLDELKKTNGEYRFNIDGSHSFLHHLKANIIGKWSTWAIKWYASVFLSSGLGLFPSKSLVRHIGFDEKATHAKNTDKPIGEIYDKPITINKIPVEEYATARAALKSYFLSLEKNPLQRYWKLFKENIKRIRLIKHIFDFLRTHMYDKRNAV